MFFYFLLEIIVIIFSIAIYIYDNSKIKNNYNIIDTNQYLLKNIEIRKCRTSYQKKSQTLTKITKLNKNFWNVGLNVQSFEFEEKQTHMRIKPIQKEL